jgi:hypothetical protein
MGLFPKISNEDSPPWLVSHEPFASIIFKDCKCTIQKTKLINSCFIKSSFPGADMQPSFFCAVAYLCFAQGSFIICRTESHRTKPSPHFCASVRISAPVGAEKANTQNPHLISALVQTCVSRLVCASVRH